jgi:hypothetical protein
MTPNRGACDVVRAIAPGIGRVVGRAVFATAWSAGACLAWFLTITLAPPVVIAAGLCTLKAALEWTALWLVASAWWLEWREQETPARRRQGLLVLWEGVCLLAAYIGVFAAYFRFKLGRGHSITPMEFFVFASAMMGGFAMIPKISRLKQKIEALRGGV